MGGVFDNPRAVLTRRTTLQGLGLAALGLFTPGVARADVVERFPWMLPWVEEDGFDRRWLDQLLGALSPIRSILAAMDSQAEAQPYYVYRNRMLTRGLVHDGRFRMKKHRTVLDRVEKELAVDSEVVVALWGVESSFGRNQGKYPVLHTLFTLASGFPRRAHFFQEELRQFLLLCREESWDPRTILGSYAGAMGQVQMMPSSMRCYALDFNGDGHRDVFTHTTDAMGSIANYLHLHGWRYQGLLTLPVEPGEHLEEIASTTVDHALPWHWWQDVGVRVTGHTMPDPQDLAALIALEGEAGMDYHLCFNNFKVIIEWNRSRRFAMLITELSQRLSRGS